MDERTRRRPVVAATTETANDAVVDLDDLDAPIRRELDELYGRTDVELHIQDARDVAYDLGLRHPV